jgi:hypothetical protein
MITTLLNKLPTTEYNQLRQAFEDETSCIVYFGNQFLGVNILVLPIGLEILEKEGVWIYGKTAGHRA